MAGGINLYGYAGHNPVTFTDPFGLCSIKKWDDCKFGSISGKLGISPVGAKAKLFGARVEGKVGLDLSASASATATASGVTTDANSTIAISASASATWGAFGAKGSASCDLTSGVTCTKAGSLGMKAGEVSTSNTSVGVGLQIGAASLDVEVDPVQAGTALVGSTLDLLVGVSKAAWGALTTSGGSISLLSSPK